MNCASETGSPAVDANDCCAQRGKRSFRNPNDGTCELCPGTVCYSMFTYTHILYHNHS